MRAATLHEDKCSFLIICHSVLLRMRNISDRRCRENQNTHFLLNSFFFFLFFPLSFQKLCHLWDNVKKTWYSQAGHRWQCSECASHTGYLSYKYTLRICTTVIAFPLQQWLYKHALMLLNTCIVCHVVPTLNSSTLSGFITCLYVVILSCILY